MPGWPSPLGRIHSSVVREGGFVLRGYHKLLAMLIVVMLVAGVATVFAKTDKTTPAAAPHAATSVLPAPPAASGGAESPAPTNSLKKSPMDELANAPMSPDTGVPSYPIGFVLVGAAALIGVFVRRLARA